LAAPIVAPQDCLVYLYVFATIKPGSGGSFGARSRNGACDFRDEFVLPLLIEKFEKSKLGMK
jgi:hypothetical protein